MYPPFLKFFGPTEIRPNFLRFPIESDTNLTQYHPILTITVHSKSQFLQFPYPTVHRAFSNSKCIKTSDYQEPIQNKVKPF